ncbi:MFS transporter [Mycobacterium sp. CBMA247]|nr:MFS transporter [Mycolicibacterium sp. CBMA 329]MUL89036.1 MFS transporter [Mycolicibacterium sp. CBMA 331]MUL97603.1 MFS transporter [Mycolicibacterium sp. CBMA 334]MUM29364.1 MFS transporter [Mycolicibacterium sp. CBMA 295]MUM38552.1 MFS transporter [Mycolicibacterium sp. CBMA 247]MUM45100.1 MFS transporter [Mycolicibacterium sp. CBMA 294]
MPALLACTALGFTGIALLLPVAPMWAVRIGADNLGAGVVNSVLMLCTVIAQLLVGRLLRRAGWAVTLALGLVLLGAPAMLHPLTSSLWQVLLLAALRGLGFGVLTVCGVSGIAGLIPQERRGRAIGAYGLAIAAPQFVLIPLAPWLAENIGYRLVFVLAAAPLLGVPLAFTRPAPILVHEPHSDRLGGISGLVGPIAALVVITAAGGGILTFAPQLGGAATAFAALLGLTGSTALARWLIGGVADRHGPARFIAPMLGVGAVGLAVIAVGIGVGLIMGAVLVVLGCVLLGVAYGALQNLTLVQAFAVTGEHARGAVSVAWNVGFDAGTGLGSLAVGALATSFSFQTAFAVMTAACVGVGLMWVSRLGAAA